MFSFCTNVLLLYAKLIFYTYFRCDHFFSSYSFSIEKKRKEKKGSHLIILETVNQTF